MNSISHAISGSQASLIANTYGQMNQGAVEGHLSGEKVTLSHQAVQTPGQTTGPEIKQEQVSLSARAARAQKIDAMAKDFFASGQFGLGDIPKLIQRLHQDGILSESQLSRLGQAGFEVPISDGAQPSLLEFIQIQRSQLQATKPDSVMVSILDDAETVLMQMENLDSQGLNQKAARVSAQLSVFVNGDQTMTDADRSMWQGLKSTMQLAASSGSSQQATGQLQRYLALSKPIT